MDFQTWNPNTQCVWEQAAAAMGLPQSQLSDLLRGRFRGISETRNDKIRLNADAGSDGLTPPPLRAGPLGEKVRLTVSVTKRQQNLVKLA